MRCASSRVNVLAVVARACACACACTWMGCSGCQGDSTPATASPAPVVKAPEPAPAAAPTPPPAAPPPGVPPLSAPYRRKDGFRPVEVLDGVPLCMFPNMQAWFEAKLLRDVGKQRLRPKNKVVIGAFGPWCVHESCDQVPSLECSVLREGDTLIVHSRYWGDHKDGSTCTTDCKSITAACNTPELEAGTYTVKHGETTFTFEVPGLLTDPCFGAERLPPGSTAAPTPGAVKAPPG